MGTLLSQVRLRTRVILSSIQHGVSARRSYASGVALLIIPMLGAATLGNLSEARGAIRHYAGNARAALFPVDGDTLVVFGPRKFSVVTSGTQLNFAESFSAPASSTPTQYTIRLQRTGGSLSTATVTINGVQVAVAADFPSTAPIERLITVSQTDPNTNSLTLTLRGDSGGGITATIFTVSNSFFTVFGPKVYTKTATTPTIVIDNFVLPAEASAPYTISAKASVAGTKAAIRVNGAETIEDIDWGTGVTNVVRPTTLVSGSNTMRVAVRGATGTTITVTITGTDRTPPALTIAAPSPNFVTNANSVTVSGTSQDRGPTQVKVNDVIATMSGAQNTQYSATVPLVEGANSIAIRATDNAGNYTDSTRTVTRDSQAPTVTLTSPADGSYTNQIAATVSGTVGGGGTVTVKVNGVTFPVGPGGTFGDSYQLSAGVNFLTAVATDEAGNSGSVTNKVTLDTDAPAVTISAPAEGLMTKETSVAVSGTVTDASPTTVTVNGVSASVGTDGSFGVTLPLATEGSNAISVVATDAASNQSTASRSVIRDTQAPVVTIASPSEGFLTNQSTVSVSGTVTDATGVALTANGVALTVDAAGNFTGEVPLAAEGTNPIAFTATDAAGNTASPTLTVRRDTQPPTLTVTAPTDNSITKTNTASIAGNVYDASPVAVSVNSAPVVVDGTGALSGSVTLTEGANILTVVATDGAGNTASQVRRVTLDTEAPVITISEPADGASIATQSVVTTGSVADASATTLTVNGAAVVIGAGGGFSGEVPLTTGLNTLSYVATDAAGNVASASRTVTRQAAGPPNPVAVATPVNKAEVTLMQENTAFLYAGANPVQTGVAPGTIAFLRAAVVRGKVLDVALAPLADVAVTIKGHPELGHTTTRSDGAYDLAVNGGGRLVLDFSKATYLPAQRNVAVPWQDYTSVDSVIMLQPDAAMTTVNLTADTIQVAQASVQTDADGPRHATVFFEPGTQATLHRADGTTEVLTSLDIRATEFTVGANGGAAMPGNLPPASQYTYAVQVTADQQLAAGPGAVLTFSQPVPLYVENFLDFPVGTKVPSGAYNPAAGAWQPRPNGVVLKILGTDAQGRASLDINGDGVADSDSLLAFNGIDPLERIKLAGTYPAGSALWRVFIIESLPHDLNWPYVILGGDAPHSKVTGPCGSEGADVLRCSLQVQTAFQSVGIVGSPFTLNYASDRTKGNVADRQLDLKLVGDTVPAFLERVDMQIDIAGKRYEASFTPTRNLAYTFVWDGKDGYGRTVQATQPALVTISYMYPVLYGVPAPGDQSFGLPCMSLTGACPLAGDIRESIRALRRVAEVVTTTLGAFDATGAGLGGFTLNVQHAYDPIGGQFFAGDGTRRVAATLPEQVTRWAGTGSAGTGGTPILNNVPKTQSVVSDPAGIVVAPDGTVYFVDRGRSRIRKVSPDGIITTVAGTGVSDFNGDDRLATTASLTNPWGLALGPDGSLYFGEQLSRNAIRRIGPDGFVRAVAGNGTCGFAGDGGPAIAARVCNVSGMGFGPDGSLYFSDTQNNRIRKIGTDGIIRTVAGTGATCFTPGTDAAPAGLFESQCGEGIPATRALLRQPTGLTVGPDGMVYFAQQSGGAFQSRIRRIDPAGFIYVFAGGDVPQMQLNEGGSAKQARLGGLSAAGMTVGPDGSVYFSSGPLGIVPELYVRVRRVRPDGRITTVAGDGTVGNPLGDNGPARRSRVGVVDGLAVTQAGDLLMSDDAEVRLVSAPLPGLAAGQTVIASTDGSEFYVFSSAGRILLTLDAVSRDTIYKFAYNTARQLISITDRDGRTTEVERDATGRPVAMLARNGQRTDVALDTNGQVQSFTGPDGRPVELHMGTTGLMDRTVGQAGDTIQYQYDVDGRVVSAENPLGGTSTYSTRTTANGSEFTTGSPTGQASVLQIEELPSGVRRVVSLLPDGTTTETTQDPDGRVVTRTADGRVTTVIPTADPRLGMQAPLTTQIMQLPSGLTKRIEQRRAVVVDTLTNLVIRQTDTTLVNGRPGVTAYEASTQRDSHISPQGRRSFTTYDIRGRAVGDSIPGMLASRLTYDASGRLTTAGQGTRTMSVGYDDFDHIEGTTNALGLQLSYVTDELGRPTRVVRADGSALAFSHDDRGNLKSFTPPNQPPHTMQYGPGGLFVSYAAPATGDGAQPTLRTYDTDGKPLAARRADGSAISFRYDPAGRPELQLLPSGDTVRFGFSATTGLLSSVRSTTGVDVNYEYDGGLLTRELWSGTVNGSVSTTYDADFRPSAQRVNNASEVLFGYDGDGGLVSLGPLSVSSDPNTGALTGTTLGSVATTLAYSPFGELSRLQTTVSGTAVHDIQLAHDAEGRIVVRDETIDGIAAHYQFAYDSAGRLATVQKDGAVAEAYEYDKNGNRIRATTPAGTVVGSVDARDRVTIYGDSRYVYTRDGELRFRILGTDTTHFTYDALGNLLTVVRADGVRIDYVVDGSNRRVGRRINGALSRAWLYDGNLTPAAELDASGQIVCRFAYATHVNVPDYATCAGTTYRLVTDERGSLRLAVNTTTGEVWLRRDYDAFGRMTLDTRPGFLPFGFGGGLYDEATGLTHFGARDYDGATGRWTARDPLGLGGGDANLYAYVGNDPINRIDPLGLEGTLNEEALKSAITNSLESGSQQFKFKIMRKMQCWAVELVTDMAVDEVVTYGVYLFSDALAGGLPYAGKTAVSTRTRALAHKAAGRLEGPFKAVFGVDAGTKLNEAEQFIMDMLRKSKGLDPEAVLGKNGGGVANQINAMNKADRAALRKSYNLC